MRKTIASAVVACALTLSLLSGCGNPVERVEQLVAGSAEPAQQVGFRLAYRADDSMNPLTCRTVENQLLSQLCYEGLFALDRDFQPQKVLCDSISRTGTRSYTLTIKHGVRFHSGEELTAKDVVYSLNHARRDDDSIYKEQLSAISSVRYDGDEVRIRLYEPSSNLAALLDVPIIRRNSEEDAPCPDGTGPYQLTRDDSVVQLKAFSDWNGGSVGFDRTISLISMEDSAGEMNLLTAGGLSLILQQDAESASVVQAGESVNVPTTQLHYLGVNCADDTLDDPAVRTALSMLMNRDALVTICFGGRATATAVPMQGVPDGVKCTQYDKNAALELLADAGIYDRNGDGTLDRANGEPFALDVIYNTAYHTKSSVLQQYAHMLGDVGIALTATPLDFESCRARLEDGDFQLYYGEYHMTADFDAGTLFREGGARNFGSYSGQEMEECLRALDEADEDERAQAVADYLTCFCAHTPIIPIVFEQATVTAASSLPERFDPWPDAIFHGIADWEAS